MRLVELSVRKMVKFDAPADKIIFGINSKNAEFYLANKEQIEKATA